MGAVFAGIAAASAAPKADPWLVAHPAVYLGDAHTQTGDQVEYPNGAVVPDNTLSVKAATADQALLRTLWLWLWWVVRLLRINEKKCNCCKLTAHAQSSHERDLGNHQNLWCLFVTSAKVCLTSTNI